MRHLTGNIYALDFSADDFDKHQGSLAEVPGLRVVPALRRVEGSVDAVAAATIRVGQEVLALPRSSSFDDSSLREYQQRGVGWLIHTLRKHGGAILADDMGLGKTLQAIKAGVELTRGGGRVLVICPAFLRESWRLELAKWGETSVVCLGPKPSGKKKLEAWGEAWLMSHTAKWVVTSYDMAERAIPTAFKTGLPRMLIMDEAHYLKGRNVKRAKTLENIAALCTYRLAITGTPLWSRPRDFYQLLALLFGRRFGTGFAFDMAYSGGSVNMYGGLENSGATNTEELKQRVNTYMLRRLKQDVAKDLPELTRHVIWLEPTSQATAAFHIALASKDSGATYAALQATLESKMEPVLNAASQAKRFLLFTYLKAHAYEMARRLNEDMDCPCTVITGDMASDQRVAMVNAAAVSGIGVVATLDSMGAGINAQGLGGVGFFHALDHVPAKMAQAEARLHRIGQTRGVVWTYFAMKESMDELVVNNIIGKLDQHIAVMGDGREMYNNFNESHSPDVEAASLKALYDSL